VRVLLKAAKDAVTRKDSPSMKMSDNKPATQTNTDKTSMSTAAEDSTAVEEYRAKLAEKRRLAREKAEIEAEEQQQIKRLQQ